MTDSGSGSIKVKGQIRGQIKWHGSTMWLLADSDWWKHRRIPSFWTDNLPSAKALESSEEFLLICKLKWSTAGAPT